MEQQIQAALQKLDPTNDDHWTDNGAPRIDVVAGFMGVDKTTLRRDMITGAAPRLTRATFAEFIEAAQDDPEGDDEVAAAAPQTAVDDVRSDYNTRIRALEEELTPLQDAADQARRAVQSKQDEIDALINERDKTVPKVSPATVLKAHLEKQHQLRAERVAREQKGGMSPLDQALRGRKRQSRAIPLAAG